MIEHLIATKMLFHLIAPMDQRSFYLQTGDYLFENNDLDSLIKKINSFLKENEYKKNAQILSCKKKTRDYTIFQHYKTLVLLLNLN